MPKQVKTVVPRSVMWKCVNLKQKKSNIAQNVLGFRNGSYS